MLVVDKVWRTIKKYGYWGSDISEDFLEESAKDMYENGCDDDEVADGLMELVEYVREIEKENKEERYDRVK